ncbi:hypothetical protein MKEN_01378700 [Mycena kentingensis (nom. inval.)]|nr:hypothetical protein MKEN_01378700 [Mycena kentingensis (nom. inval.)]
MGGQAVPNVNDDVAAFFRTNYVGFAGFTVLIWDHLDTFVDEVRVLCSLWTPQRHLPGVPCMQVEYVWKGKKGTLVYLFLLNRYLIPLGFIINLFAYLSPTWTVDRYACRQFIRYEGSMTLIGIHVVALMMLLRIYALYSTKRVIVWGVGLLFLVSLGMNAWLLTRGEAVVHNPDSRVVACTMIFPPEISILASSSAWLPLLYDSVVLVLTLAKAIPFVTKRNGTYVMKRILEDGLLYYSVIFSVTAVLTIMIVSAPPGLKNIAAQLELLITVTMMSRITLNLKKCAREGADSAFARDSGPVVFNLRRRTQPRSGTNSMGEGMSGEARAYRAPAEWA